MRWPAAQVTGIDFSATSVRSTEELKRKYHLDNLQVHQLPIERVGDLERASIKLSAPGFSIILRTPMRGSALCAACLNRTARCISWCMRLMDGPASICCRNSADGSASMPTMRRSAISSLRSQRCHPAIRWKICCARPRISARRRRSPMRCCTRRTARYSVPQLFDLIEKAGLTFGRWLKQAPYSPRCGVLAQIPQASRLAQLSVAEQYAAVELFRGTMVRHSAVVYRDDSPGGPQPVSFAGDAWLGYVPLRMPDTICVQERLPPGAAAVSDQPDTRLQGSNHANRFNGKAFVRCH